MIRVETTACPEFVPYRRGRRAVRSPWTNRSPETNRPTPWRGISRVIDHRRGTFIEPRPEHDRGQSRRLKTNLPLRAKTCEAVRMARCGNRCYSSPQLCSVPRGRVRREKRMRSRGRGFSPKDEVHGNDSQPWRWPTRDSIREHRRATSHRRARQVSEAGRRIGSLASRNDLGEQDVWAGCHSRNRRMDR